MITEIAACVALAKSSPFSECSKILNSVRAANLASNCSERLWLYARTILVALENYFGWLGESNQSNSELATYTSLTYASSLSLLYLCLYQSANTTLSLQLPMKFGNIVRVKTPRYLTRLRHCKGRLQRFLQPSIRLRYNCYYSWWQPSEVGCAYRI